MVGHFYNFCPTFVPALSCRQDKLGVSVAFCDLVFLCDPRQREQGLSLTLMPVLAVVSSWKVALPYLNRRGGDQCCCNVISHSWLTCVGRSSFFWNEDKMSRLGEGRGTGRRWRRKAKLRLDWEKMMDWLINEKRKEEFLSFIHWIQQAMFMKIEDITNNYFSSLQLSWSDLNILVRNVGWSYCLLQVVMNYMIRKKSLVSLNFPNVVKGLLKLLEHFFSDQSDVILLSKQEKLSWFFEMLGENRSIEE